MCKRGVPKYCNLWRMKVVESSGLMHTRDDMCTQKRWYVYAKEMWIHMRKRQAEILQLMTHKELKVNAQKRWYIALNIYIYTHIYEYIYIYIRTYLWIYIYTHTYFSKELLVHEYFSKPCTRCFFEKVACSRMGTWPVNRCGPIAICEEGHCDGKMRWDPVG